MQQSKCEQPAAGESGESYQCQSVTNSSACPAERRVGPGLEQRFPRGEVMTSDKKQVSLSGEQGLFDRSTMV